MFNKITIRKINGYFIKHVCIYMDLNQAFPYTNGDRTKFSVCCPYCHSYNNHVITFGRYLRYCHTCGRIFSTNCHKIQPFSWSSLYGVNYLEEPAPCQEHKCQR